MGFYFSAKGRTSRSQYWLGYLGIVIFIVLGTAVTGDPKSVDLFIVLSWYPTIIINIKRLHDTDTTGWLSILGLFVLPAVIIGSIQGTQGSNRFGEDPLSNKE